MSLGALVVDTNAVVAGLLTGDPSAPTARLLDALLAGSVPFLLSPELLAEYRTVLLRPKIRAAHGLGVDEVDRLLLRLAELAIVRDPHGSGDRGERARRADEHLFALLETEPAARLVSGDAAALRRAGERGRTPRAWLDEREARASIP